MTAETTPASPTAHVLRPTGLPALTDRDLVPQGAWRWWTCRYCGGSEHARIRLDAEATRRLAHEALCPDRPAGLPLTAGEADAVETHVGGHLRGLLRQIDEWVAELKSHPDAGFSTDIRRDLAALQIRRGQTVAELTLIGLAETPPSPLMPLAGDQLPDSEGTTREC